MIRVLERGIKEKPPAEAWTCPVCGEVVSKYYLREKRLDPYREAMLRNCYGAPETPPNVPTFNCTSCGTIWQWTPDPHPVPKPDPEPEAHKEPEQPEQAKDDSATSERQLTPDMVALVAAQYHAENHKDDPDEDVKLSWWGRLARCFVEHLKKLDKTLDRW